MQGSNIQFRKQEPLRAAVRRPVQRLATRSADRRIRRSPRLDEGFTILELLVVLAIGIILTAATVPVLSSTMSRMRLNSAVASISTAISKTRYLSIRNSDIYTLAITVPQNTYVVTDVSANVVYRVEPLPSLVAINGGAAAVYTYTFCPNGTVYGAGGTCVNNANLPPALSATYQKRQTNISVSTVGNVTTKNIH
jgi:prepilin-type N-terminal cleavage/methylation domain-containing protein